MDKQLFVADGLSCLATPVASFLLVSYAAGKAIVPEIINNMTRMNVVSDNGLVFVSAA